MTRMLAVLTIVLLTLCHIVAAGQSRIRTTIVKPGSTHSAASSWIPRPVFRGLHVGLSEDSAKLVMKDISSKVRTMTLDSMLLIETDSTTIFSQPAYVQLQLLKHKVRTIVINYHPLSGDRYLGVRDNLTHYMEQFYGRGIPTQNESLTHRRWETEDGTMEVSYTDKYTRVFVRLGKPQH